MKVRTSAGWVTLMSGDTRNLARMTAGGTVVQSGAIFGDVHVHQHDLPAVPKQLPLSPTWLTARDRELERLTEAVEGDSLAVLAVEGPGGVGKTALALHWAHRNIGRFPDGQLFVDLRGFGSSRKRMSSVSAIREFLISLGVAPRVIPFDAAAAAALYRSVLSNKRLLLFLDNVVDSSQVIPLLPGGPPGVVMVTSRHQLSGLRLYGATRLRLDPLDYADARSYLKRQVGSRIEIEPEAVETLLRRCAGLPLALGIMAARASSHPDFPLSVLANELTEERAGLNAFDAGDGTANLHAVLSSSVTGLDAKQTLMFRLLGAVPVRDFGVAAAASMVGLPEGVTRQLLRELEARHLVDQHQPERFRMHELVHAHAAELSRVEDSDAVRDGALRRLVDFYLHTARAGDVLLYSHRTSVPANKPVRGCTPLRLADERAALAWFTEERSQLLAMLRVAVGHDWDQQAWLLSRALDTYLYRAGHVLENVESSRIGATAADRMGDASIRALAYRQLGRAYTNAGRLSEAETALRLVLTLIAQDDRVGRAHTLHDLARASSLAGRYEQAIDHAIEAAALYREVGNPVGTAHALNAQGYHRAALGDYEHARQCCESALALHVANGNGGGELATLQTLGFIASCAGRHGEAIAHYSRALRLCHQQSNHFAEALIVEQLADEQLTQGHRAEAVDGLRHAHDLYSSQNRLKEAERVLEKSSALAER